MISLPDSNWEEKFDQWSHTNDHWHNYRIMSNIQGFNEHLQQYVEMVDWIKTNVVNYEKNALWTMLDGRAYIKLQQDKDAVMFVLRWNP